MFSQTHYYANRQSKGESIRKKTYLDNRYGESTMHVCGTFVFTYNTAPNERRILTRGELLVAGPFSMNLT